MKRKISLSEVYLLANLHGSYSEFCSHIAKIMSDISETSDSTNFIKRVHLTFDLPPAKWEDDE